MRLRAFCNNGYGRILLTDVIRNNPTNEHYMKTCPKNFHASSSGDSDMQDTAMHSKKVLLPTLGQNGTLLLRSNARSIGQVHFISQWRDDTVLELIPLLNDTYMNCSSKRIEKDSMPLIIQPPKTLGSSVQNHTLGGFDFNFRCDEVQTSLGRLDSLVEVHILNLNADDILSSDALGLQWKIVATVPEKSNITCHVENGDLQVTGKLEGDANLSTLNGSITVSKLRGHSVVLKSAHYEVSNDVIAKDQKPNSTEFKGGIHISKSIEARTIRMNASKRIRARMINGSDVAIHVSPMPSSENCDKLDNDDEGAVIDIGSLYVSSGSTIDCSAGSEAQLTVDLLRASCTSSLCNTGLIRLKSNHGHVTVHAKLNDTALSPTNVQPIVDLGGVNGSCDILLESHVSTNRPDFIATRVHFDSMTNESISTVTSRGKIGDISITLDRKLNTDVRFLSLDKSATLLPYAVDAHSISSEEVESIKAVVDHVEQSSTVFGIDSIAAHRNKDPILIQTDAYQGHWGDQIFESSYNSVNYAQGVVQNRSGELDSRFDVRSRGKINIDGAASQALDGFRGNENDAKKKVDHAQPLSTFPPLPLLCVATDGKIKLETLSWLGSIARRYGLEENDRSPIGRQASRSPRLKE